MQCLNDRQSDVNLYLMGPFPMCHFLTDFVREPLLCFLSKKVFADFIYHHVKRLMVAGLVIGKRDHFTVGLSDNFLNIVGPLTFENI